MMPKPMAWCVSVRTSTIAIVAPEWWATSEEANVKETRENNTGLFNHRGHGKEDEERSGSQYRIERISITPPTTLHTSRSNNPICTKKRIHAANRLTSASMPTITDSSPYVQLQLPFASRLWLPASHRSVTHSAGATPLLPKFHWRGPGPGITRCSNRVSWLRRDVTTGFNDVMALPYFQDVRCSQSVNGEGGCGIVFQMQVCSAHCSCRYGVGAIYSTEIYFFRTKEAVLDTTSTTARTSPFRLLI